MMKQIYKDYKIIFLKNHRRQTLPKLLLPYSKSFLTSENHLNRKNNKGLAQQNRKKQEFTYVEQQLFSYKINKQQRQQQLSKRRQQIKKKIKMNIQKNIQNIIPTDSVKQNLAINLKKKKKQELQYQIFKINSLIPIYQQHKIYPQVKISSITTIDQQGLKTDHKLSTNHFDNTNKIYITNQYQQNLIKNSLNRSTKKLNTKKRKQNKSVRNIIQNIQKLKVNKSQQNKQKAFSQCQQIMPWNVEKHQQQR